MSNKKYIVDTNRAPRAIGPYSQAVGYDGQLFISGQTALDARTGQMSNAGVEQQTRVVMDHVQSILMAAGLDTSHVLRVTVYLRNMNDYDIFNDIYALYFDHSPPARTVVEVSRLPKDALISVDVTAAAPADYTSSREDASYDEAPEEVATEEAEDEVSDEAPADVSDADSTSDTQVDLESPVRADSDAQDSDEGADDAPLEASEQTLEVQQAQKKTLPFGTIPAPQRRTADEEE